jgi:hypothetical protein
MYRRIRSEALEGREAEEAEERNGDLIAQHAKKRGIERR